MRTERHLYVTNRERARQLTRQLEPTRTWASVDAEQHLSIDAMKLLSIPTFGAHDQPAETYYHSTVSVTPMAVFDEGKGEAVVYLYDQTSPTTCSDSVVSCLDRFLTDHQYGCQRLLINLDNCPVNKSKTVPIPAAPLAVVEKFSFFHFHHFPSLC